MNQKISFSIKKAIIELLKSEFDNEREFMKKKREIAKKKSISIPSNSFILKIYRELKAENKIKQDRKLEALLKKRAVRTMSGIAPVAVLTKAYECPGECAYCPTEKDVPQSYLSNEPAVMRAIRCNYNPYLQVHDRLRALIANGHNPTKIELIVIGGTWSYFPDKYKYYYILNCFAAVNEFPLQKEEEKYKISDYSTEELRKFLVKEQKKNEKADYKIIGLTLETRPDYINIREIWQMRELGCTRVELGVQTLDDQILKKNKRGHGVGEIVKATEDLRNHGFKITYHIMPGLPGSDLQKDFQIFKKYFSDPRFRPDQIKFYPTVVTKGSLLYKWWKEGSYKPYSNKELQSLIIKCKKEVPEYVRIIRLIRDIPGESIVAGNLTTNLRQIMKDQGVECRCIRCREIKGEKSKKENQEFEIIKYSANGGREYFLFYIDKKSDKILAFCRLRLHRRNIFGSAIIRELHVYGQLVSIGEEREIQHSGFGKKLVERAEEIAKAKGFKIMTIIAGVGVRNYYKKFGYKFQDSYMIKKLK